MIAALLLLAFTSFSAPVPFYPERPALHGAFTAAWHGGTALMEFEAGERGKITRTPGVEPEAFFWKLDGDVLTIDERLPSGPCGGTNGWREYSFTLRPGRLDGSDGRGRPFSMRRVPR